MLCEDFGIGLQGKNILDAVRAALPAGSLRSVQGMQTDFSKCLCSLDEKISCPFRIDGGLCSDKNKKCGFVIRVVTEPKLKPYVRKPRWYEKYYKGTRRVW